MRRFIAVDSGKSQTKVAYLTEEFLASDMKDTTNAIAVTSFRTAFENNATFEDDEPGNGTFIVEFEGNVYKVGKTARQDAALDSTKKTLIHKLCTMLSIARICSAQAVDEVSVSIGIPIDLYSVVKDRNEYRDFIAPIGEHSVTYRDLDGTIVTKTFRIVQHFVCPESIGAIFETDYAGLVGVIDIGHLNVNMTVYSSGDIDANKQKTTTKGINYLVSSLTQQLSSQLQAQIDNRTTITTISRPEKTLRSVNRPNPKAEELSHKIIVDGINDYIRDMLEDLKSKNWAIDYMNIVVIGGGAALLKNELKSVLGEGIVIPDNSTFTNAIGFLALMCGKSETLHIKLV